MKISLSNPLFQEAMPVLNEIESHGYEAYFVGGCVRDALMQRPINDVDIATSATPEEIESIFKATFDVGKEHGTIVVVWAGKSYEVTTFRTEGDYSDFRHPDSVQFVRSLKEDTLRRDFTVNAMAVNAEGDVIDHHGGLADLDQAMIRCVGNPVERFEEDALRMFRAIRFASQLGFRIESATFDAIVAMSANIAHISMERIRIEMNKFLTGLYFGKLAKLLATTGIGKYLPGMNAASIDQLMEVMAEDYSTKDNDCLDKALYSDERLAWARLVGHLKPKGTQKAYLRQWTHSNHFIDQVVELKGIFDDMDKGQLTVWQIYTYDIELLALAETYYLCKGWLSKPYVKETYDALPIKDRKEIKVKGQEVIQSLGLSKGGPIVGQTIAKVEQAIVNGDIYNERDAIMAFLTDQRDRLAKGGVDGG